MPITYKYDNEANIIRTTASGKVKTGDLRDYVTKVLEDTRIKKGFIEIADFESVTDLVVAYSEINQFPFVWGKYMENGCKGVFGGKGSDALWKKRRPLGRRWRRRR